MLILPVYRTLARLRQAYADLPCQPPTTLPDIQLASYVKLASLQLTCTILASTQQAYAD